RSPTHYKLTVVALAREGGRMRSYEHHNPCCDGGYCLHSHGPVRVYPFGGGATLILCRSCWRHENAYRFDLGKENGAPENWPLVDKDAAKPYPEQQQGLEGGR